jgi:hypothetical protein
MKVLTFVPFCLCKQTERITIKHDALWLKLTWDKCVCKKHKVALNKSNKETGGGDGELYCPDVLF